MLKNIILFLIFIVFIIDVLPRNIKYYSDLIKFLPMQYKPYTNYSKSTILEGLSLSKKWLRFLSGSESQFNFSTQQQTKNWTFSKSEFAKNKKIGPYFKFKTGSELSYFQGFYINNRLLFPKLYPLKRVKEKSFSFRDIIERRKFKKKNRFKIANSIIFSCFIKLKHIFAYFKNS